MSSMISLAGSMLLDQGHNHDATKRFQWLWQKQRLNALRDSVREAKANLLLALVGTGLYALHWQHHGVLERLSNSDRNDVTALHFRLDRLEAFAHASRTENKAVLRQILE
jgi:transposase